jgi:hypothetical protein
MPSGNRKQGVALLSLSLSVLKNLSYPLKRGCLKTFLFLNTLFYFCINSSITCFDKERDARVFSSA